MWKALRKTNKLGKSSRRLGQNHVILRKVIKVLTLTLTYRDMPEIISFAIVCEPYPQQTLMVESTGNNIFIASVDCIYLIFGT